VKSRIFARFCLFFSITALMTLFLACQLIPTTEIQSSTSSIPITTSNSQTSSSVTEQNLFPSIHVNTSGVLIDSKEIYTDCKISISGTINEYVLDQVSGGIRIRGHSTSNFEKTPYRIRFEERTQPLGLGSGPSRSWILLADYVDLSMMRNYISYKLANDLLRKSFSSEAEFVELYINGVHKGIYLLVEQTQVGTYRVNLDETGIDDPLVVDTGFLLELETDFGRRNAEGYHMVDWFEVPGYTNMDIEFSWQNMANYPLSNEVGFYVIKSDAKSLAQIQFIQNYMVSVYNAIYLTKTFEAINALVDIESAVDMYLMQLISNDFDYNYSSNYIYKDAGGKLVFGPPWDHDLAYGNHGSNTGYDTLHLFHLLYQLSTYEWFQTLIIQRWAEITAKDNNLIEAMKESIILHTSLYNQRFSTNHNLWIGTRRTDGWHTIYIKANSQIEAANYLLQWIDNRVDWIESQFSNWTK